MKTRRRRRRENRRLINYRFPAAALRRKPRVKPPRVMRGKKRLRPSLRAARNLVLTIR